jgi:glycosyltransferase involved in cell wall biosynthesis
MKHLSPDSPIRVLHPITRLIVGGAQENTMFTAALLNKERYKAEILSGPQTGSEGSLIDEVRANGVPLTIMPDLLRQVSPWRDFRALTGMARFIRKADYSIVHTHSSKAGILGRLAARIAGVPIIVHTVHGWSFHDYMPSAMCAFYKLLERWMASFTDAIIVVTGRDIQKGQQAHIGKDEQYHLIRSAIPLEDFDPARTKCQATRQELGIPMEAVVVGNVGRFSEQKNPLDWVRVAGIIGRSDPRLHFLLVGDGPLRPQVETQLQEEGIRDRTIVTGLRRDVSNLMSAMDIFMLSSLWEGLPRVIPQAMAMGLPVVANQADGTDDAIHDGENGYLCSPGEIEMMAERCQDLICDPLKRLEMGKRGRAYAKKEFDLRRMIDQIEALYEQLLANIV